MNSSFPHLSFREVQFLGDFPSLCGTKVFVLIECLFQFKYLLRGEFGSHPTVGTRLALTDVPDLALRA